MVQCDIMVPSVKFCFLCFKLISPLSHWASSMNMNMNIAFEAPIHELESQNLVNNIDLLGHSLYKKDWCCGETGTWDLLYHKWKNLIKSFNIYHNWNINSNWIVYISRKEEGFYPLIYFASMDEKGYFNKLFMLLKKNPKDYYNKSLYFFNTPDFMKRKVELDIHHKKFWLFLLSIFIVDLIDVYSLIIL